MKKFLYVLTLPFVLSCNSASYQEDLQKEVVENYAKIVYTNYYDAYQTAVSLDQSIDSFLIEPSDEHFQIVKSKWLTARESYGQTEAFRFYGGPIDGENGPEGQLNAWPLDEAYIDYVAGTNNNANIINSPEQFPQIDAELIASLNEKGSETNVSSGYHAIEFLLWGQDLTAGPGAGQRPYTDYVTGEQGTAAHQKRRRTYLDATSELLLNDLRYLLDAWKKGEDNYRKEFVNNPSQSIGNILSGLGKLSKGELAGERMFVAYDLRSKEDEHSCFSDNTHRDILANAIGIQNVYEGKYNSSRTNKTISGASIKELIAIKDEALAQKLSQIISESVEACQAIQPPFDQEIKNPEGRERIANAIRLLRRQGDLFAEAAQLLGYQFDPEAV